MRKTLPLLAILLFGLVLAASCKEGKSENPKDPTEQTDGASDETFTFVSTDGSYKFQLRNIEEGIILRDLSNNKTYTMESVLSGSGAKFESQDGYVFWNKGKEFMFLRGDSIVTQGSLLEAKASQHLEN